MLRRVKEDRRSSAAIAQLQVREKSVNPIAKSVRTTVSNMSLKAVRKNQDQLNQSIPLRHRRSQNIKMIPRSQTFLPLMMRLDAPMDGSKILKNREVSQRAK